MDFAPCLATSIPRPAPLLLSALATLTTLTSSTARAEEGTRWEDILREAPPIQYSTLSGPSFLNTTTRTYEVVAGGTAKLHCGVRNLHNFTVSWVRGADIRLLTTGSITYTSDSRFVAVNPSKGDQWLLKIHYVRMSDAGSYLCQVSTTPPITLTVNLTVQEAVASVMPGREVFVKSGSRLEVVCQVEGCPPPALLAWTRGGQKVHMPDSLRYDLAKNNGSLSVSRLTLARQSATASDSGNYSCTSTCTIPINVTVHVLRGEELAAMQHHNTSSGPSPSSLLLILLQAVLLLDAHYTLGRRYLGTLRLLAVPHDKPPSPHTPALT
ncbi:hemicentin-1-like [Eriocheir sinensis]|uniref:hemicentin-1-like n=1 Tax=Eriocheir sinensis TaxID=95602 RepID=UPI0021CA505C|nr:hemicentin-1-like [Eriocheir sinensis]